MCLWDILKPSFLPRLIFNWRTFSRRVTARWWRQWAKNQVPTNENSVVSHCQTYYMFNALDHAFQTNIIAYYQQNRYVRLAIYTDWFTLNIYYVSIKKMLNVFLQGNGLKFVYMMITSIVVETAFSWNPENKFSYWLQMRQHQYS